MHLERVSGWFKNYLNKYTEITFKYLYHMLQIILYSVQAITNLMDNPFISIFVLYLFHYHYRLRLSRHYCGVQSIKYQKLFRHETFFVLPMLQLWLKYNVDRARARNEDANSIPPATMVRFRSKFVLLFHHVGFLKRSKSR